MARIYMHELQRWVEQPTFTIHDDGGEGWSSVQVGYDTDENGQTHWKFIISDPNEDKVYIEDADFVLVKRPNEDEIDDREKGGG